MTKRRLTALLREAFDEGWFAHENDVYGRAAISYRKEVAERIATQATHELDAVAPSSARVANQ